MMLPAWALGGGGILAGLGISTLLGGRESKKEAAVAAAATQSTPSNSRVTLFPYAVNQPSTVTTTTNNNQQAWQYAPQVSYQLNSTGASSGGAVTKKDALTATTDQTASSTPSASLPSTITTTPSLTSSPSTSQSTGPDMTMMVLIGGAALVLYGLVSK